MSIYGNPVMMGGSGGGGGGTAEVLLNEHEYKTTGGGTLSFSKSVTIVVSGTYFVAAHGYSDSMIVTLNGVSQPLSYERNSDYVRWYEETLSLSSGDVLSFNVTSTGYSAASAQVIRIA